MWTAASIFEELGEFGWFCGDFFFDHNAKLTYKSIYRFLNNPEAGKDATRLFEIALRLGPSTDAWLGWAAAQYAAGHAARFAVARHCRVKLFHELAANAVYARCLLREPLL